MDGAAGSLQERQQRIVPGQGAIKIEERRPSGVGQRFLGVAWVNIH